MPKNYSLFHESMLLRDHLALDRTVLASERTFLAYLRTSISFLASGVAAIKLLDGTPVMHLLGWLMIAASPFFLVLGLIRFVMVRKTINSLGRTEEDGRQGIAGMAKNAADGIENGARDAGHGVKRVAVNASRSVTPSGPRHQTEKTKDS